MVNLYNIRIFFDFESLIIIKENYNYIFYKIKNTIIDNLNLKKALNTKMFKVKLNPLKKNSSFKLSSYDRSSSKNNNGSSFFGDSQGYDLSQSFLSKSLKNEEQLDNFHQEIDEEAKICNEW